MFKKFNLIITKIHFYLILDGVKRAEYLKKKNILYHIGENCMFQSRLFPMDPKLLIIHDNVTIAANVTFCTHDAIRHVLTYKEKKHFNSFRKPIEINENVFIGIGSIIMPNVKIGKNCIIGAGSVVTKDIPDNEIWAGNPAKKIGTFNDLVKKRIKNKEYSIEEIWNNFHSEK